MAWNPITPGAWILTVLPPSVSFLLLCGLASCYSLITGWLSVCLSMWLRIRSSVLEVQNLSLNRVSETVNLLRIHILIFHDDCHGLRIA